MSNQANATLSEGQKLFKERLNRVETAIHLGEPDKVPVFTFFSSYIIYSVHITLTTPIFFITLKPQVKLPLSSTKIILNWTLH